MSYVTAAALNILEKSESQLSHVILTAHRENIVHPLAPQGALRADALPAGAPSATDLNAILDNVVQAPGATSIVTVPNTPDIALYQMLGQVQALDSYISLLTAFCVYNEHPVPYDISKPDQASAFARATAKWRNYVITGGWVKAMAGYLPVGSIVTHSFSKQVTSADLHAEFLAMLFGGFAFPKATMTELDSILTKVSNQLDSLRMSFESQSYTLDHFLTYYYFVTMPGTGEPGQPPAMYVAKVHTFFLHINQASWKAAVGKSSNIQFDVNYHDMDTTMNSGPVSNDMTAINAAIQTLTGQSTAQINKRMNMKAVHTDLQK